MSAKHQSNFNELVIVLFTELRNKYSILMPKKEQEKYDFLIKSLSEINQVIRDHQK